MPRLAQGIVVARGLTKPSAQDLADTYEMALTVLFRLLFIAYAEDKDLLPYRRNGLYQRRSLSCAAQPPRLHGPYYQWTNKVAGKTRTLRLSEEQARLCQEWVRNHKRLKRLVRQMERLSLKETDRALGATSRP